MKFVSAYNCSMIYPFFIDVMTLIKPRKSKWSENRTNPFPKNGLMTEKWANCIILYSWIHHDMVLCLSEKWPVIYPSRYHLSELIFFKLDRGHFVLSGSYIIKLVFVLFFAGWLISSGHPQMCNVWKIAFLWSTSNFIATIKIKWTKCYWPGCTNKSMTSVLRDNFNN